MISFEQAQKLIADHGLMTQEEEIFVSAALGRVNSMDVKAPMELPVFDNSAMDGFVLRSEDTLGVSTGDPTRLPICGVIKAGDREEITLNRGECYRIMTGSLIPFGADAVLAQEQALLEEDCLVIQEPLPRGKNIRWKGEEIERGSLILPKGSVINPGTVGFLAAMGINRIKVYQPPRISLIATGSELIAPGDSLVPGKIFDANNPMIVAALEEMRIRPILVRRLGDRLNLMKKVIDYALKEGDFIILMGGVSVGDFDHVRRVLSDSGVETIFWKVSQKPGKPLYFGKKDGRLVFGLPGNPASVFTCFYEYVYPAIRRSMGFPDPYLFSEWVELGQSVTPDTEKTLFIKARLEQNGKRSVMPLKNQKSHMLSSFCEANSFLVVPESGTTLEKGEKVQVHSLPYARVV